MRDSELVRQWTNHIYCATTCGWKGGTKYQRGREGASRQTGDFQTSDVRQAVCRETYLPLMTGSMVPGRFWGSARNDNRAAERPGFRRFRGFCPLPAGGFKGCGIAASGHACGDEYIVSVTGLIFVSEVRHDEVPKPLPADWYLWALRSLTTCTEILHCVQNDGAGRKVSPQAAEDRGVIGAASRLGFRRFRGF